MQWLARGEIELPAHDRWLSASERAHAAGLKFTKRRVEYLTRRWAAKHAVATWLGAAHDPAALAAIEVRNHRSGAPWVQVDGAPSTIEISITDRAGWAVCLVGDEPSGRTHAGSLGIDLELVEPRTDRFVSDFLTPAEQAWVRSRSGDDARDLAANLMWSAKEAALKVLQVGLRADTRSVEVRADEHRRPDGWAALEVACVDGEAFAGWWRRDGEFVLTVASRLPVEPPLRMAVSADLATAQPRHSWIDRPLT